MTVLNLTKLDICGASRIVKNIVMVILILYIVYTNIGIVLYCVNFKGAKPYSLVHRQEGNRASVPHPDEVI